MDMGSHNTLFTTSSEKLFDELNVDDPHSSSCWNYHSMSADTRELGPVLNIPPISASANDSLGHLF